MIDVVYDMARDDPDLYKRLMPYSYAHKWALAVKRDVLLNSTFGHIRNSMSDDVQEKIGQKR